MSEPNNDPPLVRKVEDAPPVRKVEEVERGAGAPGYPGSPRKAAPGFWEALLWCAVFLAGQICGLVLTTGAVFTVYALNAGDAKTFTDDQLNALKQAAEAGEKGTAARMPAELAQSLAWGMLAAQVVALGLVLLVLPWRIGRGWRRQVGVRVPSGLHLLLVLLVVPGFIVLPDAVQSLVRWLTGVEPQAVGQELSGLFGHFPIVLSLLAVAVGPGVVEEFWCRAFLGRGLCARYGIAAGVFITSLLFALMHLNPASIPAYMCMGAYLHFVYFATRSIWPPILLHAMNNGTAVVLSLVLSPEKVDQPTPVVVPLAAFALLLFGSMALWTSRAAVQPVSLRPERPEWAPEYPGVSAPPPGTGLRLGREPVSPVALVFTVVSFGALVYLFYRFMV